MKIGLLAMSGIRAHDPELLRMGLTLPGFVERSKQVAALPSLGLLCLAASTPAGHELAYFEADVEVPEAIFGCDLVAIGTFSAQVFEAYAIADRLRARGVLVAMGGTHVTACPEEALRHADFVGLGEGEPIWPEIVAAAERRWLDRGRGGAGGEAARDGRVFDARTRPPVDLNALRPPRYDLLLACGRARGYDRFPVQTTRGCPWRCDFCASSVMLGAPYRKRPVADVVRDVREVQRIAPGAFIEFADDNTFVDKRWGLELARALEPLGIKWFTETDISVADDGELLAAMARAGCRQLLIGLESPDAQALAGLELAGDFKHRRAAGAADAVRRIQAHGITVNGCFILGLDEHGPDVFERVRDFVFECGLYEVQITYSTAFPGTPLHERLRREGRILEPGRWDLCTLFDVNFQPARLSPEELRRGFRGLSRELYSAEGVRRRRQRFFENQHRVEAVPVRGSVPEMGSTAGKSTRAQAVPHR